MIDVTLSKSVSSAALWMIILSTLLALGFSGRCSSWTSSSSITGTCCRRKVSRLFCCSEYLMIGLEVASFSIARPARFGADRFLDWSFKVSPWGFKALPFLEPIEATLLSGVTSAGPLGPAPSFYWIIFGFYSSTWKLWFSILAFNLPNKPPAALD